MVGTEFARADLMRTAVTLERLLVLGLSHQRTTEPDQLVSHREALPRLMGSLAELQRLSMQGDRDICTTVEGLERTLVSQELCPHQDTTSQTIQHRVRRLSVPSRARSIGFERPNHMHEVDESVEAQVVHARRLSCMQPPQMQTFSLGRLPQPRDGMREGTRGACDTRKRMGLLRGLEGGMTMDACILVATCGTESLGLGKLAFGFLDQGSCRGIECNQRSRRAAHILARRDGWQRSHGRERVRHDLAVRGCEHVDQRTKSQLVTMQACHRAIEFLDRGHVLHMCCPACILVRLDPRLRIVGQGHRYSAPGILRVDGSCRDEGVVGTVLLSSPKWRQAVLDWLAIDRLLRASPSQEARATQQRAETPDRDPSTSRGSPLDRA